MAPAKRRGGPPVIDLTGESEPQPKVARRNGASSVRSSNQNTLPSHLHQYDPSSSSQQQTPILVEDDEDNAPEPSQVQETPYSSYEFYGEMDTKIVGVRYYNGMVNPGEMILCRREPSNQYDSNAIRVDNAMRIQIGHLPAKVALKIAPYIDRNEIILEGILTGHKNTFDCPIRLSFHGPSDSTVRLQLEEKLKSDKLLKATQLKATRKEAEAQRNAAMRLSVNATTVGLGSEEDQQQDIEEIVGESEAVRLRGEFGSGDIFSMDEETLSKLPKADQPDAIQSTLLPYQLQGLKWMLSKENPQLPAAGSDEIVQLWKCNNNGNFRNLVSNHITTTPPKLASGGVLADDMGLGKTLQVISLIMSSGFSEGPTLIVAPVGVLSNWEQQIRRHVKEDRQPRVFRYHNVTGTYSKAQLRKYEIVLTTYDKLRNDLTKKGPLGSFEWRRVVLDEAHNIRNYATARAKAAHQLRAKSRWMLSGTPIVNSTKDFLSALMFLKLTGGIEEPTFFIRLIDKPLASGKADNDNTAHKSAKYLFQLLTRDLCLRRRKDMQFVDLKLPAKTEYIHRITFTKDEQLKYDALFSETAKILQDFQKKGRGPDAQVKFSSVLEKLLRLRQMCCHWSLCGGQVKKVLEPLKDQKLVDFTEDNLKILNEALQTASDEGEECPICTDAINLHTPVITACKHRFGKACIERALQRDKRCPMCRQGLNEDLLVELQCNDTEPKFNGDTRSSKTEALEKIVNAKLQDPDSKIVIFSQWTSFLGIIAVLLDEAGHKYCRLEGSMNISRRDQSIDALTNDPDTRIMLASLGASGVGLNLVAADTVILVDSWWAPAIEDQAIDRVHRLGQTRETTVWKLVMDKSVEERVLDIQSKKRELVNVAFQEKAREQKQANRLDDVLRLLSLS